MERANKKNQRLKTQHRRLKFRWNVLISLRETKHSSILFVFEVVAWKIYRILIFVGV